jgi:hypothetical protein
MTRNSILVLLMSGAMAAAGAAYAQEAPPKPEKEVVEQDAPQPDAPKPESQGERT